MRRKLYSPIVAICALALVFTADVAFGCPLCSQTTEASAPDLAQGFTASILLMMSMPFMLVGGFGFAFWRLSKRGVEGDEEL